MGAVLQADPPKPKSLKESDSTTFTVRLKNVLLEELEAAAYEAGMSRNKAIAQLLRFALDANKAKPSKK